MTNRKDVELLIRATDQSKQTLQGVAQNIDSVTSALGKQIEAAQRGDGALDGLKQSLNELKQAGTELVREQSLIDTFNRQSEALEAAKQKSEQTAAAYEKLKAEITAAESVTKRQTASLAAAEKASQRAQDAEAKRAAALEVTSAKLEQAGLAVADLAAHQETLRASAEKVGQAIAATTIAINGNAEAVRRSREAAAELAETDRLRAESLKIQAQAADEAAAHERAFQEATASNKGSQYVREYTALLQTREDAERRAAETAKLVQAADEAAARAAQQHTEALAAEHAATMKKFEDARQLVASSEYVRFWTEQIDKMDAAEKTAAENNALQAKATKDLEAFRKIADGANMAAAGFRSFQSASTGNSGVGLGDSLRAITDPADAARKSIDGLEKQINAFASAASAAKGPVKDYNETARELQAAMKSLGGIGDTIDQFQRQVAAVRASRTAYQEAQADVKRYVEAIRSANAPDQELVAGLKQAQNALKQAGNEMQATVEKARQLQSALQSAGIATNNLDVEGQRLATMARTATQAMSSLNASYKEFGSTSEQTQQKIKLFGEGQRESLSLYQRIRGEVIALAAAYIGLQGALSLAGGALEAYVDKQAVENRLGIVIGAPDGKKIAQEYAYIHEEAERLGIGLKELADSYSRFALAAKNANLNSDQTKYAFERITEAMRVNHASTEAINGAFYQLEQMLSKNKVQMDDLRQASNWIPGLEGMLARGMGLTSVKQLFDEMKKGSVDAKVAILGLSQEMERQYAKQLPDALKSLQAEQGRFQTSVTDFKREIAEAGFADAYISLLQRLNKFFQGDEGKRYAKDIGDAFTTVSNVLKMLVDNLDTLKLVIETIVELKAVSWASDVVGQLSKMAEAAAAAAAQQKALAAANEELAAAYGITAAQAAAMTASQNTAAASASKLAGALGMIQKALILVQTAMVAWNVGEWIDQKSSTVHKFSTLIAEDFAYAWDLIKLGFERIIDGVIARAKQIPAAIGNAAKEAAASAAESTVPGALGSEAAAAIRKTKVDIPEATVNDASYNTRYQAIKARHETNLKMIDEHGGYSNDGRSLTPAEQSKQDAADRARNPQVYDLQKKALTEIRELETDLNHILDERSKKLTDIYNQQQPGTLTRAVAEKQAKDVFDSYGPKIKQFAEKSAKDLKPMIDALGLKAPMDELQKYNSKVQGALGMYQPNLDETPKDKNASKRENLAQTLQNQLEAIMSKVDKLDLGQPIEEKLKAAARAVDEQYSRIFAEIDKYQKLGGTQIAGKSIGDFEAALNAQKDQLKAAAALKIELEQIKENEKTTNDLVKARNDLYKDIEDRVKAGTLSPAKGMEEAAARGKELNAQIIAAAQNAMKFNEQMRGKPGVNNAKLDSSNAGLQRDINAAQSGNGAADAGFNKALRSADEEAINKILKERADITTTYNNLVKLGLSTTHDAATTVQSEYARTDAALQDAISSYEDLINKQKESGAITQADWDLATAKITEYKSQIKYLSPELTQLKKTFENTVSGGIVTAFDNASESLAGLIDGTKTFGDVWHDAENIVGQFFASFLKNIANAIIQLEAMKVAQDLTSSSGGGSGSSWVGTAFNAVAAYYGGVSHGGGLVGGSGQGRYVDPSVFHNAPRYHTGTNGPLGLKSDERATILQTGEEVLSRQQVAAKNAAKQNAAAGKTGTPIKQILAIGDDQINSIVNSQAGQDATITHIKQNADTIKQILA